MSTTTSMRGQPRVVALISAALLVLVVIMFPAPAMAYAKNGCYWPNNPVSWNRAVTGTYATAANAAAASWSSSTDVNMTMSYASNLKASSKNKGADGYDGYSLTNCPILNVTIAAEWWFNTHYTTGMPVNKLKAIAVHEFGHTLGLAHVTSNKQIMFHCAACVYNTYGYYTPQSDDKAGMNSIY